MMEKNTHFVVTEEVDGKYISYPMTIGNNNNLKSIFSAKNYTTINATDTKHAAQEIANAWNESWKKQGLYLYN